jgi:hypothetical protein
MKIALIVLGSLVALVALMAIIGAMLPVGHVATRSARLRKPQTDVWDACVAWAANPKWQKELKLEVIERVDPSRLVTKIGPGLPFGGTWTYELSTEGDETVLTVTERGEVYNPLFRFLSRFVFGQTRTLDDFLTQLGNRFPAPA